MNISVLNCNILKSDYIKMKCHSNGEKVTYRQLITCLSINQLTIYQILSQDFNIFSAIPFQFCDRFFCFAVERFKTCRFSCVFIFHCHQQGEKKIYKQIQHFYFTAFLFPQNEILCFFSLWSYWAEILILTQMTQMMHNFWQNTTGYKIKILIIIKTRYWTFNISCNSVNSCECVSKKENWGEGERGAQEQCTPMVRQIWKNMLVNICLFASTSNTCHSSFVRLLFLAGLRWAVGSLITFLNEELMHNFICCRKTWGHLVISIKYLIFSFERL